MCFYQKQSLLHTCYRVPNVKDVIQACGLTECGEPMSEMAGKYKPGSVGLASPGMIIKVCN